jgi:L-seryl-tRNA(Ser) seleniumtransferase
MSDYSAVPAVHRLLDHPSVAPYEVLVGRDALRELAAAELDRVRASTQAQAFDSIVAGLVRRIDAHASQALRGVINATGTLLHTNLGRAPIAAHAFDEARAIATGYSNLEYDLIEGERGSRYEHASDVLRRLTGAQDALVVNNCAAAVLLVLDTFARGADVVVARNQLVEIGGGFRLPDVLERSGARLVEAGTTNKVYVHDFERALTAKTALIMRSHQSNFSIEGFAHDVDPADLAALGKHVGVAVVEDLGSGALVDLSEYGLPRERTVMDAVRDGMSLVAFSGDKLLGGPQSGIIVGTRAHVARLRANPLVRALRVDKVTLALLTATLRAFATPEERRKIPFFAMLGQSQREVFARAERVAAALPGARAVQMDARVGGGSLPHARIASAGVRLEHGQADRLAASLRAGPAPVVARIEDQAVLLDLRTVLPDQDAALRETLKLQLV